MVMILRGWRRGGGDWTPWRGGCAELCWGMCGVGLGWICWGWVLLGFGVVWQLSWEDVFGDGCGELAVGVLVIGLGVGWVWSGGRLDSYVRESDECVAAIAVLVRGGLMGMFGVGAAICWCVGWGWGETSLGRYGMCLFGGYR